MDRRRAAALGLGVLVLAGCGAADAGQAAVSDRFTISQAQVDADVRAVLTGAGQPPGEPPTGLAVATAERLVRFALFDAQAADLGVEVTATQVQAGVDQLAAQNGGIEALEQAAVQGGLPKESIDDFVRANLQYTGIGRQLDASADATAQGEAANAALAELSDAIGVEVAPRYGSWDDATLAIVPGSGVARPADAS